MKLAFALPHALRMPALIQPWEPAVTGADQTRMIKRADELGYDMVAVPEHLVVPRDQAALSGPHYFHATTAQAYMAGATERIRVNSCVSILPLQHPIVTAKALATADWLSSGRMVATFGVGWMAKEFDSLGVPFRERGAISDEYLAAIVELWTSDQPRFAGKYVNFDEIAFEPKPVQKPHLPIWIGGDADAALRRAARFGSGWWPFMTPPQEIPARLDTIKSHRAFDGRPFEVMFGLAAAQINERHESVGDGARKLAMSSEQLADSLGELKRLGVTISSLPIPPVKSVDAYLDHAQWVIEEVRPKLD